MLLLLNLLEKYSHHFEMLCGIQQAHNTKSAHHFEPTLILVQSSPPA